MNRDVESLKVVKIQNAIYCVRCNFAYVADVLLTDGNRKKMFYCSRRDCDNWVYEEKTAPALTDSGAFGDDPGSEEDSPFAGGWEVD
ncbi:MAG: hypothetical protein KatS3mg024_2034 [Armatimonadota bacterium]|nr:MAG: hypothetical protein KatS3mg024_2034 [Armatimonadota bacterium]